MCNKCVTASVTGSVTSSVTGSVTSSVTGVTGSGEAADMFLLVDGTYSVICFETAIASLFLMGLQNNEEIGKLTALVVFFFLLKSLLP